VVYGLLCDTNRWDRLVGVSSSTYSYDLLDPDDPTSRTRIGHATSMGTRIHFAEEGEYWTPDLLRGERRFRGRGAKRLKRGFLEVDIEPTDAKRTRSRVRVRTGVTTAGPLGWIMGMIVRLRFAIVLRLYLRGLEKTLQAASGRPAADGAAPAAIQARDALVSTGSVSRIVTGRHKTVPAAAVSARAAQFAASPVDANIRRRIVGLITTQADEQLVAIKPFDVARAWRADTREVVRGFLYAARAGLFDLEWQVNCPVCRVGADAVPRLDQLGHRLHCGECDVSYDVDFADHVEATFTVSPAIRPVHREVFCASSPSWRPHVHGYVVVPGRSTRDIGPLPSGELVVRARGTARQLRVTAPARIDDSRVVARITEDRIIAVPPPSEVPSKNLRLVNETDRPVRILVERGGWEAESLRARLLMTLPDFVDLFSADAPAAGMQLAVGRLAVAFTDLVGSTELYERIGDARAFALVQEHWRAAARITASHRGAIVKTLGDGLLMSFPAVGDAIAATHEMMAQVAVMGAREGLPMAIRAGVHEGPCYLVRANDRADLFGRTVNLASRLATVGGGQQIALLDATLAHPAALAALDFDELLVERRSVELRGVAGSHRVALISRVGDDVVTTGQHPAVKAPPLSLERGERSDTIRR
jgi:class 3 adenylate cyclase